MKGKHGTEVTEGYRIRTHEELEQLAQSKGLVCVWPRQDELALDIDYPFMEIQELPPPFANCRVYLALDQHEVINAESLLVTRSVNGRMHFWLKLKQETTSTERLCLQAALGSDALKEVLSLFERTTMFETREAANQIEVWRLKHANH